MSLFNQNFLTWSNPSINRALPIGGWVELGRTTLGGVNDTISVASLANKRYYMVLSDLQASGSIGRAVRFNADSGTTYSSRFSNDGAADATLTSDTECYVSWSSSAALPRFGVDYCSNLSTKEKLIINIGDILVGVGASIAPTRGQGVGKWANTTDPIDEISMINQGAGDYASGSEVVVLGWDPADTHTTNFWEELASADLSGGAATNLSTGTFTAKKYLWVQYYLDMNGVSVSNDMTFNNVTTGTPYSKRTSANGGADGTLTSQNEIALAGDNRSVFVNAFIINNSANEKLVIWHLAGEETALASTAPFRQEGVAKWANTSSQITEIDIDSSSGSFQTNSTIKVWGSD